MIDCWQVINYRT